MDTTIKTTVSWPRRVLTLGLRYVCAIAVAFLVSALIMFITSGLLIGVVPFLTDSNPERHAITFAIAYAASLAGVLLGSMCLIGRSPGLAAVTLLILGLGYYWAWCDRAKVDWDLAGVARRPLLLPLAFGGLSAALIVMLIFRKSRQPNHQRIGKD
jgi:hypothetical protein